MNKVLLSLGETGTGLLPNVENGVFGDILTIIGLEEPGFGSTTSLMVTVEKSEHLLTDLIIYWTIKSNLYFF